MVREQYCEDTAPRSQVAPPRLSKIAILASGSGTTAEYVIHATQTGVLKAEVGLVVSNNSTAGIFDRITRLNEQYGLSIPTRHISSFQYPGGANEKGAQTAEESEAIAGLCDGYDAVVLLGYMKKVTGALLDKPVINTHPGPLPATAGCIGSEAQQRVLDLGISHSAQTLHWVDASYDTGNKIAEHAVPVMPGDTADTLFDAVQATEKTWVPIDLNTTLAKL